MTELVEVMKKEEVEREQARQQERSKLVKVLTSDIFSYPTLIPSHAFGCARACAFLVACVCVCARACPACAHTLSWVSMFFQESQALRDEMAGERRRAEEARGELEKLFFFQRELQRQKDGARDRGAGEEEDGRGENGDGIAAEELMRVMKEGESVREELRREIDTLRAELDAISAVRDVSVFVALYESSVFFVSYEIPFCATPNVVG